MATKKEQLAQEVAKAVAAGKTVAMETVDFNDPNRPKTCLEVDFPILPVNQVAIIEGNAGKPIYQMSKWWARRRSSVFRAMLIAAATKAPDDKSHAAKLVWDNYYANHQKKGAFKDLKVADIFMGGGTTLVEGSRLGMQMIGNDLNPVAWFVVKQELADVDLEEVQRLLADIEAEVKPQIMPYYYCDGPVGEKGTWKHLPSGKVMSADFDPLGIPRDERKDYRYEGPEIIYTFWSKHGPCQVTGCGHRTPIMSSPVIAVKTLTVKHWEHVCSQCNGEFHVEESSARMAPNESLHVAPSEFPFSVLDRVKGVICPHCGYTTPVNLGAPKKPNKKVQLSLLVAPTWLAGSNKFDDAGMNLGGAAQDDAASTARWSTERAKQASLIEVRGVLPDEFEHLGLTIKTSQGNVFGRGTYTCASCGTKQGVLSSVRASSKAAPFAAYAIQGVDPSLTVDAYNGRFFAPYETALARQETAAMTEWEQRKDTDLESYWPKTVIPEGITTTVKDVLPNGHGFTHWWTMFNPRQRLVHSLLLKAICTTGNYSTAAREAALGAFQQYLRNQNLFCIWDSGYDKLVPHFSNNNFYPKNNPVENNVFAKTGRGNWRACVEGVLEGLEWARNPWEVVSTAQLGRTHSALADQCTGKSEKVTLGDPVQPATIKLASSTALDHLSDGSVDMVITDPPFGDNIQYAELSDFFYVWLRLGLKNIHPDVFQGDLTLKSMEVVTNSSREPDDPDHFYQRLLTQCWREASRILKPAGLLAFTFHHSEDEPWVAVLESLFDAGFYLEATYPIRADETKGDGQFGSQKIEYDIIHVCRKRTEEPKPVSWGRMRREVMADVRQLQGMLENHAKEGLPAADIQVIRRGKALEYFSRHYGKVYVDEGRAISVKEALVGINQLIDEDADKGKDPPPVNAEPMTRQFLRTFGNATEMKRDQLQKFLKGTITTPDEFEQRGWCSEKSKVVTRVNSLEFARDWSGKHKRRLTSDFDQALVLIGACFDGSGINASDTLKNENFRPHVALKPLLEWLHKNGPDQASRNAASRAVSIYNGWAATQAVRPTQRTLFEEYEL
ncbi:DNA methylase [Betaproteobacteria bacterium MOLA814]|nr:DNA methylase [Betaproteobacteria bacterium MOLA814]